MKIRGTATDRLADVIQSLQLIHKSGLLTVERDGPGNSSQLGRIAFRDGKVIDAHVGQFVGANAFKELMAWTTCRFVFEPASPSSIAPSAPPTGYTNPTVEGRASSPAGYPSTSTIPYRSHHIQSIPDFQTLHLSRTHRQIFLLIDGKRSFQELARLTGRQPQDILSILADLEQVGLIGR